MALATDAQISGTRARRIRLALFALFELGITADCTGNYTSLWLTVFCRRQNFGEAATILAECAVRTRHVPLALLLI